jgi:hypothetical protein
MTLIELRCAETPIVLIPGHTWKRCLVDVVAVLDSVAGPAVTAMTFLNTALAMRTRNNDSKIGKEGENYTFPVLFERC